MSAPVAKSAGFSCGRIGRAAQRGDRLFRRRAIMNFDVVKETVAWQGHEDKTERSTLP